MYCTPVSYVFMNFNVQTYIYLLIHTQAYTLDQWTETELHFCTGNSLSAILDGTAKLTFLKRGEDYLITMPYAHCKGKVWI